MNKHLIIFPVLLTSAISLHVLSYTMEEPIELVQNPPISASVSPISTESLTPSSDASSKVVSVNPSKTPTKIIDKKTIVSTNTTVTTTSASPNGVVSPVPVANTSTNPSPQPSVLPSTISVNVQVASALIPTKNISDIVREAKQIGGRVDPFLSMKPPEVDKVPEIPIPSSTPIVKISSVNKGTTIPTTGPFKGLPTHMGNIPNPPDRFLSGSYETKNTTTTTTTTKIKPNLTTKKTSKTKIVKGVDKNGKPIMIVVKQDDKIVFKQEPVDKGLELTGIITGVKKLAIIKVDDESKVFAVGDIVRQDSKIKVLAINSDSQAITLSDNKKRIAKLEMKS